MNGDKYLEREVLQLRDSIATLKRENARLVDLLTDANNRAMFYRIEREKLLGVFEGFREAFDRAKGSVP